MEEVFQRFTEWFIKFVIVSAVILVGAHLLARSMRAKKNQKNQSSKTDDQHTQE